MQSQSEANARPPIDAEITRIVDYVHDYSPGKNALVAARLCLMDSIGCALLAKQYPACVRHLGPIVAGASLANGSRVIGCDFRLDPVKAAFDNGALIRWLDFNDTWLAAEWGHPSDNLGAIWAVADYMSQRSANGVPFVADVLAMMVKAYEIQGILALANSFNSVGLDHVALVKVASSAVAAFMLGAVREQTAAALSHAFADGQSLRIYRHAPNTVSRKSWAAGDATSRAVRLALIALTGEAAIPGALSTPKWGLYDVLFGGKPFVLEQDYGSYVMENILFKVSFPAEFHAQTAVECAIQLHPQVVSRLDEITRIQINTQESAMRIISKSGKLYNPADRDHCLQYMTAIGLIFGELRAEHYEDSIAANPIIDNIRGKMEVAEDPQYSRDYLDPGKRSIANAVQVFFADGQATEKTIVEYPLGHKNRRAESIPFLQAKFDMAIKAVFPAAKQTEIKELLADNERLMKTPMRDFAALMTAP